MKLTLALLFAAACRADTIDSSQVYQTGDALFHWVLTPDYGYQPVDFEGILVDGISYGATPWLVDDSQHVDLPPAPLPQACCAPPIPPPVPPDVPVVTPEPELRYLYVFLSGCMFSWVLRRKR